MRISCGAGFILTAQMLELPPVGFDGQVTCTPEGADDPTVRITLLVAVPKVATSTIRPAAFAPAVNVKDPLVAPEDIETDGGIVSATELDLRLMVVMDAVAAPMPTVHFPDWLGTTTVGLQVNEVSDTVLLPGATESVVLADAPPYEAVIVTVCAVVEVPSMMANVAVEVPPGTTMEAGIVRTPGMPPERATWAPPGGAAAVSATVHAVPAFELRLLAAQ